MNPMNTQISSFEGLQPSSVEERLIHFFERIAIWSDTQEKLVQLATGQLALDDLGLIAEETREAIARSLRGESRGEEGAANDQIGGALAMLSLRDHDHDQVKTRLNALALILEHTWGTQGFIDVLRAALGEVSHRSTVLAFCRALVEDCNTHPTQGFFRADQEYAQSLQRLWDETAEIQELFDPRTGWQHCPYLRWLLQVLPELLADDPDAITAILDEVRYPWILASVLEHLPVESEADCLLELLARSRSCLDPETGQVIDRPKWNKALLAPLTLSFITAWTERRWDAREATDECPVAISNVLAQAADTLLKRPDGLFLTVQYGATLIGRLAYQAAGQEPGLGLRVADAWCDAVRERLEALALSDDFFTTGVVWADPGLTDAAQNIFREIGRLGASQWRWSLNALHATSYLLPDSGLTGERAERITNLYIQHLAAGQGLFPSISSTMAVPTAGHQAIARAYRQLAHPLVAWQAADDWLDAARNRQFREPFADNSREAGYVEYNHLCVGVALVDQLQTDDWDDRCRRCLWQWLSRLKNRLILDAGMDVRADTARLLACHLAARLFLRSQAKDDELARLQCVRELLAPMVSVPKAALSLLETLRLNGLDPDWIGQDPVALETIRSIYQENIRWFHLEYRTESDASPLLEQWRQQERQWLVERRGDVV